MEPRERASLGPLVVRAVTRAITRAARKVRKSLGVMPYGGFDVYIGVVQKPKEPLPG